MADKPWYSGDIGCSFLVALVLILGTVEEIIRRVYPNVSEERLQKLEKRLDELEKRIPLTPEQK